MKIRYMIICSAASLLLWSTLFLFVLKKDLTVGLYHDLFKHKIAHAEKSAGARFFIIAGSNGFYSHDAETFEKRLGLPATNLSVAVMFPLDYLFDRYKTLLRPGDVVYLPLEYSNYAGNRNPNSFGNVYDITIEKNFSNLTIKSFYRCFGRFDMNYLIEAVAEGALTAFGVRPLVTVKDLTAYGDIANNTEENAKPYKAYIQSVKMPEISFSGANGCIKDFLLYAAENQITVIGGLPVNFSDTGISAEVIQQIEKTFSENKALFVKTESFSRYPRTDFFDTAYHLKRQPAIRHSEIVADEMLKKYPAIFTRGRTL